MHKEQLARTSFPVIAVSSQMAAPENEEYDRAYEWLAPEVGSLAVLAKQSMVMNIVFSRDFFTSPNDLKVILVKGVEEWFYNNLCESADEGSTIEDYDMEWEVQEWDAWADDLVNSEDCPRTGTDAEQEMMFYHRNRYHF